METTGTAAEVTATESPAVSIPRQLLRYGSHLAAVYAIVHTTTLWLAGLVHQTLLPMLQGRPPAVSLIQFEFSHLFAFSFFPAMIVAFAYAQWYPHRVSLFVWVVPLAILVYKFCVFPSPAFADHFAAAFHEYFEGGFLIGEFHSFKELFQLAAGVDIQRGMQQLDFTAPFYAGVGYSFGAFLGMRYYVPRFTAAWRKLKPTGTSADEPGCNQE